MEPPRVDMEELHRQGFTVLRKMVPADVTARARSVMDRILGPPCREVADPSLGRVYQGEPAGLQGQYYAAAREGLRTGRAVVTSGAHRHGIRHPIFDPVMAELVTAGGMIEVQKQLLGGEPVNMKLMQHLMVRSDGPSAGEEAATTAATARGQTDPSRQPVGWHADQLWPTDWLDTPPPRRGYFHTLTALSDVRPGGAAFMVQPGSNAVAREAIASLPPAERAQLSSRDMPNHAEVNAKVRAAVWSGDRVQPEEPPGAIEVLLEEGDVCVFDLFTLHSASTMQHAGESRFVLFSTFFDAGHDDTNASVVPDGPMGPGGFKFPDVMRQALPPSLRGLLDWRHPPSEPGENCG